jgi:2,3-bisphosphoglycerate-independent phosphoglycerate mutase
MDRDRRWERTERVVDLLLDGRGSHQTSGSAAIEQSYKVGLTDEFIEPHVIGEPASIDPTTDVAIFFNFRPDRARQLTARLMDNGADVVTMTKYHADYPNPALFAPVEVHDSVPEVIGKLGLRHLHAAETEKYAHVTYFFAGGREVEFPGETRILVQSPTEVPTYDLAPAMSARDLTNRVIEAWRTGFAFGIVNLANPDMVGHTGDLSATTRAVEVVDDCVGRLVDAVQSSGGVAVITADHGNAEHMLESDGSPNTAHTTNPVPVIVTDSDICLHPSGVLSDVAPTMLSLLGIDPPPVMTAHSLIR